MQPALQPYPTYKPSGIDWLGDIPKHWDVRRLKQVALLNPSRTEARATLPDYTPVVFLPMERVGEDGGIDQSETRSAHEVWNGFTYFRWGDVLVAKITPCFENGKGAYLGTLRTNVGFGSTEFHVLRANGAANPQFLYRLTTTREFRRQGANAMTGAAGQQRVPASFVADYAIPLPPLDEQQAIVRYLDEADDRIRRAISAKERLIELLTEQRQAVIHHAVTRGLDPNVRLKDSGVEWLGEVPAHWGVRRAKHFYGEVDERSTTGKEELMSVSHITGVTPRKSSVTMFLADNNIGYKICRPGDIAINTMWAYMAALGVAWQKGIVSPSYGVYRPRSASTFNPHYVDPLLRTATYKAEYLRRSTGITSSRFRLYPDQFLGIPLLCPPAAEQADIVRYLDKATADIDSAIANTERQVDLLREYRTRLIADVVTGKVGVRDQV